MAPQGKPGDWRDLVNGAVLQCVEAATLGMPFEVWKTRMGRFTHESTFTAFRNVYLEGGGVYAFWRGTSAKMVESASKGAVLLYSKELILNSMEAAGFSNTVSGFVAGAGAGVCQTTVMGPCTFLVTAVVTGKEKTSVTAKAVEVWKAQGIKGFYPGGTAIAFRQATNWASRQGLTEWVRGMLRRRNHGGDPSAKLTVGEEVTSGILGGALSAWNQPFEVARIQMQAAANEGKPKQNMLQVFQSIVKQQGVGGLFTGIVPRVGLGIWQTLFMVTGAKLVKQMLQGGGGK
uniref:Mitochondrial carrier protein n=1 Tax=Chromera velia CCMP2878 TaxID=1169474 RepID=A0A0G4ICQ9_9ALVE|eukprot:Cvel_13110.t1-p1 / transcript=Cvel_13110.t1 / gene=Cvel_13110 / organism=Chromera_velia_CCMP2878 / gene_product=Mitochondrial DNA replication protein YHM2, putative / transcript_product=Mitochondrial DNA replication protein YHM2, putative / location=Cvel_scaffold883:48782-49645(+) / protein_length=288 / sequence_SO=supercontig / SO=protein_coding / is_pseudo=false